VADRDEALVIPEDGFWPAPEIPQPNIYPMEWRVESAKLAAIARLRPGGPLDCAPRTDLGRAGR
jgi:hypothetical protein